MSFKGLWTTLSTNPLTWIVFGIAGFSALIKGVDTLIGKQEKLARTKLEGLNEDISTYDEEIQSLEALQVKLESAKGNKSELAKIQNELNDAIGETTGLLNGEGKAYDIANAKLKANIELKKQQRQQATKDKVSASKDLFDGNVYEVDWDFDVTGDQMRTVTKEYQKYLKEYETLSKKDKEFWKKLDVENAEDYAFKAIKDKGIDLGGGTTRVFSFDKTDWSDYWNEQVQTAYDVFDDVIQNYDGIGGQDFIKNLIDNMVRGGSDLSEISNVINQVMDNEKLQNSINSYWESLVNPDIDSEKALESVKDMIDDIIKEYPQLETFFTNFYEGIVSGAKTVTDEVGDTVTKSAGYSKTKMISSINDMSEGFESLDKIFASIKDKDPFDFKLLDDTNFKETFGELEGYANFIEQITSNSDDIDACRSAFNDLVTEWITSTGVLNNLTDENANLTVSMLKQMGVVNAEEIVLAQLNAPKEASIEVGKDFTDITEEEIDALIAEGTVSATTCQYLSQLKLAKLDVNKLQLDTKGDVDNILAIANAAGASVAQIYTLKIALENLQNTKTTSLNALKKGVSVYNNSIQNQEALKQNKLSVEDQLKQAQKEVQGVLNSIQNSAKLNASDFYANYNGGSTSNKDGSSKETKEDINWIETAISRLQRSITNFGKTVSATWKSWSERNKALKDQMSALTHEINVQNNAYQKYMKLANGVGLSEKYASLVRNGSMDVSTITDEEDLANKINLYKEYYEAALEAQDASIDANNDLVSLSSTEFENTSKQFEDKLALAQHKMDVINAQIEQEKSSNYTISNESQNKSITAQRENIALLKEEYKSLNKVLQDVEKAGVSKDSEAYQSMYQTLLGVEKSIIDAESNLEDSVTGFVEHNFDGISQQFDDELSLIEHRANMLNTSIEQLETNGYMAGKSLYESLIDTEQDKIVKLQSKLSNLESTLESSGIQKYSKEWYELNAEIVSTKESIEQTKVAISELETSIQEFDWGMFEKVQKAISDINDEADFLIELMSNDKLFNDDGSMTDKGLATLGLYTQKYNTYMIQADKYADEINDINRQLAKDPYNQKLLSQKEEYIQLQRDSILAAEGEKQSIKDLMSDGYQKMLDSFDEIISKRKDALRITKNLYDYEKKISEQVNDVAKYQKIIDSVSGMADTEEGKALIQKYEVSLKEAEDNLKESEYEKYISDTERILDSLYNEAELFISQKTDNIDGLIGDAIQATNNNADTISKALSTEAGSIGTTLSQAMKDIWSGTGGMKEVVSPYEKKIGDVEKAVSDGTTSLSKVIGDVEKAITDMEKAYEEASKKKVQESTSSSSSNNTSQKQTTTSTTNNSSKTNTSTNTTSKTTTQTASKPTTEPATTEKTITVGGKINAGSAQIYDYAGDTSGERQFYRTDPIYQVLSEKNGYLKVRYHKLSSGTTGWFKKSDVKAYKTGGLVDYTGLAWVDGQKGKPEAFLNANDTELFSKLKDSLDIVSKTNMFDAIQSYAKLPNIEHNNGGDKNVEIHFENMTFPNVKDANDFITELQHSKRFENIILEITDGKNSLSKYKW